MWIDQKFPRILGMNAARPLRRSRSNRMIAGVVGGLADHFGLNPTLARIIYVLVSIFSAAFPGILVYILLWILIPQED
ncbi:MAG: Putative stress-responsive transcriptional regulator [Rhodanobacteraceae bacterium]|nr:MAG: Putative stress-responsive transcriptional regulator [Rhodanobacteraceae bacterium]